MKRVKRTSEEGWLSDYTLISCKNVLYKNVEAEICRKFKNILRIIQGSHLSQHQNLFVYLHGQWWYCLFALDFYVNTILNTAFHDWIRIFWRTRVKFYYRISTSACTKNVYYTKNVWCSFLEKLRRLSVDEKIHNSFKKACILYTLFGATPSHLTITRLWLTWNKLQFKKSLSFNLEMIFNNTLKYHMEGG